MSRAKAGDLPDPKELPMIREWLQKSRIRSGMSRLEFAQQMGISANYYGQVESGSKRPSGAFLRKIADSLGAMQTLRAIAPSIAFAPGGHRQYTPDESELAPTSTVEQAVLSPEFATLLDALGKRIPDGTTTLERVDSNELEPWGIFTHQMVLLEEISARHEAAEGELVLATYHGQRTWGFVNRQEGLHLISPGFAVMAALQVDMGLFHRMGYDHLPVVNRLWTDLTPPLRRAILIFETAPLVNSRLTTHPRYPMLTPDSHLPVDVVIHQLVHSAFAEGTFFSMNWKS